MAWLKALVSLLGLITELVGWAKELEKAGKTNELMALTAAFAELRVAKTSQDRQNVAKKLQGVISTL
jgi:hypothetical protein